MARTEAGHASAGSIGYEFEPEREFFIQAAKHSAESGVNNVELDPLAETAGKARRQSTQHFWALNIRQRPSGFYLSTPRRA